MAVLYSDLEVGDSSKITAELDAKNIPYSVEAGGTIIKVPESQVLKIRVTMASQGLPNHGSLIGYEIFDKEETLGTTNFLQNVKMVRALEGELTRTISSFDQVAKARVHLVIPQREVFSKDRQDPRASVILKLKSQRALGKGEVNAMTHLIVTAVPGLDIKNITIVDTSGRSLKIGGEDDSSFNASGSNTTEDYRTSYENRLTRVVEDLLEKSLGVGKVRAQVSVEMNFDRIVTNAETYDPDSAVIRSSQSIEERERTPISGEDTLDISMANNLPGNSSNMESALSNQAATIERTDETKNYEISKTIRSEISEAGVVQKLSVAVLVDGNYKRDPNTGETQYSPRTTEELAQIERLVKAAVGFKESRKDQINVVNMPFMSDISALDEDNWLRDQLPSLFQSLVLAVVVILVFLTVVRPIALKLFDANKSSDAARRGDIVGGDESEAEIEISLSEQKVQVASIRKVNEVMGAHPEESLMVLRKWLNNNG